MASSLATSLLLLVALLIIPVWGGSFLAWQVGLFLLYGIAAQGVGLAWGKAGILPLGNSLFFGLGAYCTAALLQVTDGALVTSSLGMLLICGVCALIAFGIGVVLFRSPAGSGPSFSLVTLALVLIAAQLAESMPGLTGGFNGMSGFPTLAGLNAFGNLFYLIAGFTVLVTLLLLLLNQTPLGLILRGLTDDEARLQVLGFKTSHIKAGVFGVSAFITALAGGLYASHQGIVTPEALGFLLAAEFVIWAAVGGRLHPLGPLLGAVVIGLLSAELRDSFAWWEVTIALIFLVVVLLLPNGAVDLFVRLVSRLRHNIFGAQRPALCVGTPPPPPSQASQKNQDITFRDIALNVGDIQILKDLSFTIPAAGIMCMIGPNGAGKTTVLNALTGQLPVSSGRILKGDRRLDKGKPWHMTGYGIARKMQIPSVFETLTVQENLQIAHFSGRMSLAAYFHPQTFTWLSGAVEAILNHPHVTLQQSMEELAGSLSQGQRQQLELALALASEPSLILLDEPAAGLSPDETQTMVELILSYVKQFSAAALIIEHDMALVEALKADVIVIHQGTVLAQGALAEIREDSEVGKVYAGSHK